MDNLERGTRTARAFNAALPIVRELALAAVRANDAIAEKTPLQQTAAGSVDRVSCWLGTLSKLTDSGDWQAYACALRAMLETTVDLALLTLEPKDVERIQMWEMGAQYKHGRSCEKRGDIHDGLLEWLAAHKDAVEAYWKTQPGGKQHMRWTAHQLGQDVETVIKKFPKLTVERAYNTMYSFSNWQVHGSGNIVNAMGNGGIVASIGIALMECAELSFQCIEMGSTLIGNFDPGAFSQARSAWRNRGLEKLGFDPDSD